MTSAARILLLALALVVAFAFASPAAADHRPRHKPRVEQRTTVPVGVWVALSVPFVGLALVVGVRAVRR